MRLIGVRIAHALDDADRVVFQEAMKAVHRRVKRDAIINAVMRRLLQGRPQPRVIRIVVRDDGVEPVIAAGELNDDENRVAGPSALGRRRLGRRPTQKVGQNAVEGDETTPRGRDLQKFTATHRTSPQELALISEPRLAVSRRRTRNIARHMVAKVHVANNPRTAAS